MVVVLLPFLNTEPRRDTDTSILVRIDVKVYLF